MSYILVVAGARPNFMKVDPLLKALSSCGVPAKLLHTGQHYDANMSDVFFADLGMRAPDAFLGVGSGSHAKQTADIMIKFEEFVLSDRPSWVVVAGDVNSTVACSLVASKLGIKICHLEAGLRSFDWSMPEEINRVVTDRLSDILLTPSPDGDENLLKEGVPAERIKLVGNIMIDTLLRLLPEAKKRPTLGNLGLKSGEYFLGTFHRPSNVDQPEALRDLVDIITEYCAHLPFVLPLHPRTRKELERAGLINQLTDNQNVCLLEPQGFIDFLSLSSQAKAVLTDSGGIQEESTVLGIPCLTLRENTERPITVTQGSNELVGRDRKKISLCLEKIMSGRWKESSCPELWDGQTAGRCATILADRL